MLARRHSLNHPIIGPIDLPLLVPSFTSKGFRLDPYGQRNRQRDISEVAYVLESLKAVEKNALLISGYDIHFKHLIPPNATSGLKGYLKKTNLVVVDSGGYELTKDYDSTEPKLMQYPVKEGYCKEAYRRELSKLLVSKKPLPLLITNFDHGNSGLPLEQQIADARELFDEFKHVSTGFILKPTGTRGPAADFVRPYDFSDHTFSSLDGFSVIGVTEERTRG